MSAPPDTSKENKPLTRTGYVFHKYDAIHLIIRRDTRTEIEIQSQPVAKKRKIGPAPSFGSQTVIQQPSFTEVLERLREEGLQESAGASLYVSSLL